MEFKLFYKSYDYKASINAVKQFKQATGEDLWSTLLRYMVTFTNSRKAGDSIADTLSKLSEVVGFVESAQLFYCLAKQESKTLTLDEIEDAMFHAGILPSQEEGDMCEPYPFVLYQIALDIITYHSTLSTEKKPSAPF